MKTSCRRHQENGMTPLALHRTLQAVLALAGAMLIASCGGGGGAGELGSGGTGVGTVTGFGSIYVDGTPFNDSNAEVKVDDDNSLDQTVAGEAKLGQRVEVAFETEGIAKTISVQAELLGPVADNSAGVLKVLGQTVLVNTDPALGPVTQLSPYASAAAITVGDVVEVHGVPRPQGSGFVIQATRIEKRAVVPQYLRVSGVVAGLTTVNGATQFNLGALTVQTQGELIVPASRALADGQSVVVWARADRLVAGAAPAVTASLVRIRDRIASPQKAYLGGLVTGLSASRFSLGGVSVDFAGAVVTPNSTALAEGRYVQVRGDFGSDGVLVASQVKVRDGSLLDADIRGTLTGFNAVTSSFKVRDVTVRSAMATLDDKCPATGLEDGLFVEVSGQIGLGGIDAKSIKCSRTDPPGAIIERRGVASQVRPLLRSFTLTPTGGAPLTVRWRVLLTFFRDGLTPSSLDGKALRVEGAVASDGAIEATKIRLDN
jgi:hypothetical protein